MKTTIGGDRLGSGNKQEISLRNYERSTHDLGYLWRSSMSAGTLVPFMSEVGLPGDSFDIDLACEVLTLPTIGPLFGSYKVQLDVFQIPIRLYNAGLHMNRLGIGMDMSSVYLPKLNVTTNNHLDYRQTFDDNEQVSSSALLKYLGIGGIGEVAGVTNPCVRKFNAVPLLGYYEIYKNYYANKQEERGFVVHTSDEATNDNQAITEVRLFENSDYIGQLLGNATTHAGNEDTRLVFEFGNLVQEPDATEIVIQIDAVNTNLMDAFENQFWNNSTNELTVTGFIGNSASVDWEVGLQNVPAIGGIGAQITLEEFALSDIDDMREAILQAPFSAGELNINDVGLDLYDLWNTKIGGDTPDATYSVQYSQEGLAIKTYQSDLFNNWISTEWIDGANGINEVTSVDTTGDSFTIDALNLASKVYNMLNRIAISGGTYDDWLDAVYTHERSRSVESPIYHGSLIKELSFEEVISNSETVEQPLGTLAGRGRLTNKNKGGKVKIKIDEPSYVMGIVSLTPRIDYSQGNKWDVDLDTLNDLHKPALDSIGYQDLITEQMLWTDTTYNSNDGNMVKRSAGKQPAWINYMTNVNRVYGNFAEQNKEMFMTNNRRYEKEGDGRIADLTTYVDPSKFNHIFAETNLDAQNYWVQISVGNTARRKMSAKVIPNL